MSCSTISCSFAFSVSPLPSSLTPPHTFAFFSVSSCYFLLMRASACVRAPSVFFDFLPQPLSVSFGPLRSSSATSTVSFSSTSSLPYPMSSLSCPACWMRAQTSVLMHARAPVRSRVCPRSYIDAQHVFAVLYARNIFYIFSLFSMIFHYFLWFSIIF